jgi:hypothetical protein
MMRDDASRRTKRLHPGPNRKPILPIDDDGLRRSVSLNENQWLSLDAEARKIAEPPRAIERGRDELDERLDELDKRLPEIDKRLAEIAERRAELDRGRGEIARGVGQIARGAGEIAKRLGEVA